MKVKSRRIFLSGIQIIRRVLSILTAIIAGLLIFLTIICFLLVSQLRLPEKNDEWFQKTRLADNGRVFLADIFLVYSMKDDTVAINQIFYSNRWQDWEMLFINLVPADWLSQEVSAMLKVMMNWLQSEDTTVPNLSLNMRPIRAALRDPQIIPFLIPSLKNQPICTDSTPLVAGELFRCIPPFSDLTTVARLHAQTMASLIPDMVTIESLQEVGFLPTGINQFFISIKAYYGLLGELPGFAISAIVLTLCLYSLLNSQSLAGLLLALRWPFLIAAGLLLLGFGFARFLDHFLFEIILNNFLYYNRIEFQTLIKDVLLTSAQMIAPVLMEASLLCLGSSIVFYLAGRGLARRKQQQQKAARLAAERKPRIRKVFR